MYIRISTSTDTETARALNQLRKEGISVADVLRIGVMIWREAPELFYTYAYKLKYIKEKAKKEAEP